MEFREQLILVLVSQVPLAIYTIWNGIKRAKPEVKKIEAEEEAALADAMQGAGKTLANAWKRIGELESWKDEASRKISQLEDDLRLWRNYAARLIRQIKEIAPNVIPVAFETDPLIFKNARKSDGA